VKQPHVLTRQAATHLINCKTHYAEDLARTVPPESWQRLSTGAGTKENGITVGSYRTGYRQPEGFNRWFLFRRCPKHPDDHVLLATIRFLPSDTSLETRSGSPVSMANEEVFNLLKTNLRGLRSSLMDGCPAITLVLAAAFLSVLLSLNLWENFQLLHFSSSRRGWLCLWAVRGFSSGLGP